MEKQQNQPERIMFMRYLLFILLFGNMQLLATDVRWDGTDSGKNAYTRSLHLQHQKDIEKLADSTFKKPVHPFYQMLFWAQRSSLGDKLESWLVQHLLNTAGHWGWSKDKTAGKCETNIYYEVGLLHFLSQPKVTITTQAPQFLAQIHKDLKQMIQHADIKIDWRTIDWKAYSQFRSLWHTRDGWEVPMDNRKSFTRYYITSMYCDIMTKASKSEVDASIKPYVNAGAHQKLQTVPKRVINCLAHGYTLPQLIFDESMLDLFIKDINSIEEWIFQLEDGTRIYRNAQWVYLGNEDYRAKSLLLETPSINEMPLSAPLELEHSSTPEEMFVSIRRAGLKVKGVMPASLAYLLHR